MAVEQDEYANPVAARNGAKESHITRVQDVTREAIEAFLGEDKTADEFDIVICVAGFPCQDLSILNRKRRDLRGQKSGLFIQVVRVHA